MTRTKLWLGALGLMAMATFTQSILAATCTSKATGNWNAATTWTCTAGTTPATTDDVVLASSWTVSLNNNNRTAASLTINPGATLNDDGQNLTINGNVVNNGTFGTNGGALIMRGSNATISGNGVFSNTDLQADASGISLPVGSTMSFTNGAQVRVGRGNSGTFTLNGTINGTGLASGDRILRVYESSSATINGTINAPNANIRVEQNASLTNNGSVNVQYLDSDGNNTTSVWTQGVNSSLTLSLTPTNTWQGTFNASATGNTVTYTADVTPLTPSSNTYYNIWHPDCAKVSGFTILGSSPCGPVVSSINLASTNPTAPAASVSWTVTFSASETGVTAANFALIQAGGVSGATIISVTGAGTTWTVNASTGSGTGTLGLNMVNVTGVSPAVTSAMPFVGQVYTVSAPFCSPPSNIPAGVSVTCVCDQFGRASLNPSTIFGGNWTLSHGATDSAGTNPYINTTTGLLRLTENTNNNAKAATVPGIFPAAGNYISVEFNHYAYRGGNTGADGIAVTLSDYTVPAVPGGFGGSLGYAQRTDSTPNPPGFAGGWVGIALDEFGNFQNPTEGRILGPGARPQSVSVRGPGSGINGYRYMGGTASSSGGFNISANSTNATVAPGYMYQVVVDARNAGTGTINVSVNRDATTKDGSSYASLFGPFNANTEASYALSQNWISQLVPDYWKISFTGSTGGSTNVHEIGSLRICAQTVLPATGGTASGFSAIDEAYTGTPVPAYSNFQTGDIYMKLAGTSFKLWVAALTGTAISTGYSATSNKYVQVKLVDNTDNACGPNSARTCNSTCTGKSGVEAGASQIATFTSGSSTGVASPSPTFTLNSSYKNLIAVMKECTTSTCVAFTATTPACSADSFSVRPLSIASVASIETPSGAGNAAVGTTGTPIFRAGSGNFALTATTSGVSGSPSGYTGVMKINNAVVQAASPATVAGAVAGTTFPAATPATPSSTATATTFTYSEVGGFKLPGFDPATDTTTRRSVYDGVATADECTTPGLTTAQCDTLKAATWTGVDSVSTSADCVADSYSNTKDVSGKYGCNFGLLPNAVVFGRFVPDHFDTVVKYDTGSKVFMTCLSGLTCPASGDLIYGNGFVYSGQPFTTQVTARNAAGIITLNYDSAKTLSKAVTLSAWDAPGGATANPGGGGLTPTPNTIPSSAFSAGVALILNTPAYTFTTTPTAPTDIFMRAIDTDNISSLRATASASVEGGLKVVSGRIKVSNAYGSELLPLPMTATVQYWNGASWATSTTDSVNPFAIGTQSIVKGPLVAANLTSTVVSDSCTATVFCTGVKKINLDSAKVAGSVDISLNAPAYLPSLAGRATFGVYQGSINIIYMRENY